jgi:membrane protein YqaA with SNARE-associated domain
MLLLGTFGVCLVSALFPLINAETYVGALAVAEPEVQVWALAAVAGVGQTCGKLIYYFLGKSSLDWRWVRRKTDSPKWQARLAKWQRRTHDSPWTATGLVAVSAVLGLPPLAIISILAGQLRAPLVLFTVAVLTGRTLRFAALFAGVSAVHLG